MKIYNHVVSSVEDIIVAHTRSGVYRYILNKVSIGVVERITHTSHTPVADVADLLYRQLDLFVSVTCTEISMYEHTK